MREYGGSYILNREEAAMLRQEIVHPDMEALRKRDRFLASFSDVPIAFMPDGGMSFVIPAAAAKPLTEHITIPANMYAFTSGLSTCFSSGEASFASIAA